MKRIDWAFVAPWALYLIGMGYAAYRTAQYLKAFGY